MSCIFCDIVNKKANASIIFENKKVICFLPKEMEVYGHLLVVPKDHYENIFDISKEDLFEFISVVQDMSNHIKKSLGATGVNILNANGKDAETQLPVSGKIFIILSSLNPPYFEYAFIALIEA